VGDSLFTSANLGVRAFVCRHLGRDAFHRGVCPGVRGSTLGRHVCLCFSRLVCWLSWHAVFGGAVSDSARTGGLSLPGVLFLTSGRCEYVVVCGVSGGLMGYRSPAS